MSFHTTAATRFDSFNLYQTSYKKIGHHEIQVIILVPKDIASGKRPVFVRWHGGGLVSTTLLTQ
jgi:cephalosporin-C deacetylase-like acetyl esterase